MIYLTKNGQQKTFTTLYNSADMEDAVDKIKVSIKDLCRFPSGEFLSIDKSLYIDELIYLCSFKEEYTIEKIWRTSNNIRIICLEETHPAVNTIINYTRTYIDNRRFTTIFIRRDDLNKKIIFKLIDNLICNYFINEYKLPNLSSINLLLSVDINNNRYIIPSAIRFIDDYINAIIDLHSIIIGEDELYELYTDNEELSNLLPEETFIELVDHLDGSYYIDAAKEIMEYHLNKMEEETNA